MRSRDEKSRVRRCGVWSAPALGRPGPCTVEKLVARWEVNRPLRDRVSIYPAGGERDVEWNPWATTTAPEGPHLKMRSRWKTLPLQRDGSGGSS